MANLVDSYRIMAAAFNQFNDTLIRQDSSIHSVKRRRKQLESQLNGAMSNLTLYTDERIMDLKENQTEHQQRIWEVLETVNASLHELSVSRLVEEHQTVVQRINANLTHINDILSFDLYGKLSKCYVFNESYYATD